MLKEFETIADVESNKDYEINVLQNEDLSIKNMYPNYQNLLSTRITSA